MSSQLNLTDYGETDGFVAWDTVSPAEWAAVGIGAAFCLFILCSCVWIIHKRSYPPFKAKQWPLLLVSGFAGIIYWTGSLASLRIFPNTGPFLVYCGLFSFWMTWLALLIYAHVLLFRVFRLYWLLVLRFQHSTLQYYGGFLLTCTIPSVLMIIGTALKLDGPTIENGIPSCSMDSSFQVAVYVWTGVLACIGLVLAFLLRNCPKRALKEFKANIIVMSAFALDFIVQVAFFVRDYQNHVWGRVVILFLVLASITFPFFFYIGPALYHSIVDSEEYEKKFWKEMDVEMEEFSSVRQYQSSQESKQNPKHDSITLQDGNLSKSALELLSIRAEREASPPSASELDV